MFEQHQTVNKLLKNIISAYGLGPQDLARAWAEFRDKLELHMKAEEQVIFAFSDWGSPEMQQIVARLLSEHGRIRALISDLVSQKRLETEALEDLQKTLFAHEALECERLYPMLDGELGEDGREFLFKKMGEYKI